MEWKKFMEKNVGRLDRIARIIIGVALLMAFALGYVPGLPGYLVLLISVILMFTGVAGWCCCYALLGISTKEKGGTAPTSKFRGKK